MPGVLSVPPQFRSLDADEHIRTRNAFIALAAARHAQYPQYDGHWRDWVLVVITRNITLKGGRGLDLWQITIGKRQPDRSPLGPWTVYSPQRNSNIGALMDSDVLEVKVG